MVVLSVGILTKSGKLLMSRQYVDMSRIRVEGLMAAFPKLMSSSAVRQQQHTFVETDQVRYVYHPLETMYLVLITNKKSNIIEDLETLRLLSKVVPDTCGGMWLTEDNVTEKAFELIFAFDEVLTQGGHRIQITLPEIRSNLLMESHDEMVYNEAQTEKEDAAREVAKRRAAEIQKDKRAQRRAGKQSATGFGGGGDDGGYSGGGGGGDMGMGMFQPDVMATPAYEEPKHEYRKPAKAVRGMSLGKKSKSKRNTSALLGAMAAEEGIDLRQAAAAGEAPAAAAEAPVQSGPVGDIELKVTESLKVMCARDGGLESLDVRGMLMVTAHTSAGSVAQVKIAHQTDGFQVQANPAIDRKTLSSSGVLRPKSQSKPFVIGQGVGALRWRMGKGGDPESLLPISFACWPEANGGRTHVNLEYTLERAEMTLHNVLVQIPLGTDDPPEIDGEMAGSYRHNKREGCLEWVIDMVSSDNDSGTLEFFVSHEDEDAFFPLMVKFQSTNVLCPVAVETAEGEGRTLQVKQSALLETSSYQVGQIE